MLRTRIEKLRTYLNENSLDSFVLSSTSSLRYFFGFTGSSGLGLITDKTVFFMTDFRYKKKSAEEVETDELIISDAQLLDSLKNIPEIKSCARTGFESEYMSYSDYIKLKSSLSHTIIPCEDVTAVLSSEKSDPEIRNIKKACEITVKVFDEIIRLIREGVEERDIAAEISFRIISNGGEGDAFEPLVLFGERTASPHGSPGKKRLKNGELILLDFGAMINGYGSDFTRTLILGEPDRSKREIYLAVKEAHGIAVNTVKIDIPAKEVDKAARDCIKRRGFDLYFGHATGHGLGLEIHSLPKISAKSIDILRKNNVFTIEPGIYIDGIGGVRIEDTVLLSDDKCDILTETSRDLISL